ncbi:MAG TPA: hypothetical protein VHX87_00470 [Galbitalea sp.]|jgi:hypothetical protein|nr:hypothetical protein [Galbitalea sp.]
MGEKQPREHGLIFGRGDELDDDVQDPPTAPSPFGFGIGIPAYNGPPIPFGDPPPEPVELVGKVPWELQDGPDDKPPSQAST